MSMHDNESMSLKERLSAGPKCIRGLGMLVRVANATGGHRHVWPAPPCPEMARLCGRPTTTRDTGRMQVRPRHFGWRQDDARRQCRVKVIDSPCQRKRFQMRRGRVPLEFCESTSDTTAHLIITGEGGQARGIVRTVFLQLKCVHVLLAPHPSCGFRLQA